VKQHTAVIVDDAEDVRALVRIRLGMGGAFDVVGEGGTGVDAIELARAHRPDLLLLDISMPVMDGLEAIARVREASPATKIVMFSGFEEQGLAERALELGATDFINKSWSLAALPARLLEICAGEPGSAEASPPAESVELDERTSEAELVLHEHLERFRAVFEEAAIGMATLALSGRIVRANHLFGSLVATSAADLVGMSYIELFPEDQRSTVAAAVGRLASGASEVERLVHPLAGRDRPWVESTIAVVVDSQRRPMYLFLQAQDITQQRAAEEELRRSEDRFRLLVESVSDYAIYMLDAQGNVASWNLGAERTKGYGADDVVGRYYGIFHTEEDQARGHPQEELRLAAEHGHFEEEGWRVRKDGSRFWANVTVTPVRDREGAIIGFAKVTRDITERRRIEEQQEQVARDRTEFLAVTAHELRSPVALIAGFASTLRTYWDEVDDGQRREMLETLDRNGRRLTRLVDDLLVASRIEAGGLDIRPTATALRRVVEEVVTDASGPDIDVDVDAGLHVLADPIRLQQMLDNYLANAVRYGKAPIVVSAEPTAEGVLIRVSDRGPGVPSGLVPRLFGKFVRGQADRGTGLGLFIVRSLARAQGGDAWYEARPDGGACFTIRLPAA
jgi:PAS domain S-box-containing protein